MAYKIQKNKQGFRESQNWFELLSQEVSAYKD